MQNSLLQYLEYKALNDYFPYYLRVNLNWDDDNYLRMVSLIKNILEEYKDNDLFPKDAVLFFTKDITTILSIISNPLFGKTRDDDYKQLVEKRKIELQTFQRDFFIGNLFD